MNEKLDFDGIVAAVVANKAARLIAIDGLPVSGKSTLAERLAAALQAECIYLDDFVKPEAQWRSRDVPSFPFDYIRYGELLDAVKSLNRRGTCSYRPYDWLSGTVQHETRTIRLAGPVIVEGVSALHPELAPLYDLRIWVESDAGTTLSAALERGAGVCNGNGARSSSRASISICRPNRGNGPSFMLPAAASSDKPKLKGERVHVRPE